jgi:hypothetical protein
MTMRWCATFLLALALALARPSKLAWAEEADVATDVRPATGADRLGGGIVLTAFGALSFATAPICKTGVVIPAEQNACFTTSLMVGTPVLVAGITLIVIGAVEHSKYNEWARRHPNLVGLSLSPASHGGAFGWSATF